jgi:DNA-binding NarL/FixJ family response regulator
MSAAEALPTTDEPARLVLVDDHKLARDGLRDMLTDVVEVEIVGEAQDGKEALELCLCERPDLVLMDLRMPRMDGLEATRQIKRHQPQTSVLVMTMHENADYLLEALRAGAAGYILKDASQDDVISAIRRALSGESPFAPELAARLLRRLALEAAREGQKESSFSRESREKRAKLAQQLTPRELEVLKMLAQGKTNHEIAEEFVLSKGTVKNHVEHIIEKLNVSGRTQAVVQALELGIISFPE